MTYAYYEHVQHDTRVFSRHNHAAVDISRKFREASEKTQPVTAYAFALKFPNATVVITQPTAYQLPIKNGIFGNNK